MKTRLLRSFLKPELVRVNISATCKREAILTLLNIVDDAGSLRDRDEAERVVFERERNMSTGLERGVAIPHGKTDSVDNLLVAIATKPDGLDFDSADGQPAKILVLTLSPAGRSGPHIRFMAEISRLLRDDVLRRRVVEAQSADEIVSLLTR
ncbi:MAG: PTS sugar transporter subunit IIA [Candidatus Pacebacteria bacterium]|nr:PTS sugar transporter subunit IIA [Candidatus Paceibacterota bacterium]